MFYGLFSAVFLGGAVGALSERFGFTRNGYVVSIAIAIGGAMILWFVQFLLGLNLGLGRGMTSIVGSVGLLFLSSMRR
ncbi:MAG: hypothetical protein AAF367_18025 [Pseudomonadota bacterium]